MNISRSSVSIPQGFLSYIFSKTSSGFSINLDSRIKTKRECIGDIKNISLITRGTEGSIYDISVPTSEKILKYILKITIRDDENYENEIKFSRIASDEGFGVKIYDNFLCEVKLIENVEHISKGIHTANFTIMKRYDMSLLDWFHKYGKRYWFRQKDNIIENITNLIRKLHFQDINHGDLHLGNILLKNNDGQITDMVLTDFGRASLGINNNFDEKTIATNINELLSGLDIPDRLNYKEFL